MSRCGALLPTYIYWLVDTSRTDWPKGEPFYCGKSIYPDRRLYQHVYAANRQECRKVCRRVRACPDGALRMEIVAVVPSGEPWQPVERMWIAQIRLTNPNGYTNVSDGGCGGVSRNHVGIVEAKYQFIRPRVENRFWKILPNRPLLTGHERRYAAREARWLHRMAHIGIPINVLKPKYYSVSAIIS